MSADTQRALIWGAGGGIGRATAEHLASAGWQVAGVARDAGRLNGVVSLALEADLARPHTVQTAAYFAGMEFDEVDLFVYAAGDIISTRVISTGVEDWERILTANLSGAFLATQASLPLLKEDAHLVYTGAYTERLRVPGLAAYAAAKAGLEAFVDILTREERRKRVTLLRLAAVDTPLWNKVPSARPNKTLEPAAVGQAIREAYESGHSGRLDL